MNFRTKQLLLLCVYNTLELMFGKKKKNHGHHRPRIGIRSRTIREEGYEILVLILYSLRGTNIYSISFIRAAEDRFASYTIMKIN